MKFTEAQFIPDWRNRLPQYRVTDQRGRYFWFRTAEQANARFPGAFDRHPDYEEQSCPAQ